jgi:hypothetical protein
LIRILEKWNARSVDQCITPVSNQAATVDTVEGLGNVSISVKLIKIEIEPYIRKTELPRGNSVSFYRRIIKLLFETKRSIMPMFLG